MLLTDKSETHTHLFHLYFAKKLDLLCGAAHLISLITAQLKTLQLPFALCPGCSREATLHNSSD